MISYRNATQGELSVILNWAASEGWNPGIDDRDAFFEADPDGFFLAFKDETPVAAISVVNHSDVFAFLGLYIVVPEHRGEGIGYNLWQHAIEHACGRTIGLDGVPAQQTNYEVSKFEKASVTIRYTGVIHGREGSNIRSAKASDIPVLISLEAEQSGANKEHFLSAWFRATSNRQTLLLEENGSLVGFCTVRACKDGVKIGPLWAQTAATAECLISHAATVFSATVSIDVSIRSSGLTQLCKRIGLQPGFETARMYQGDFISPATEFFAVTSLELG